jgi:hypothetical protein
MNQFSVLPVHIRAEDPIVCGWDNQRCDAGIRPKVYVRRAPKLAEFSGVHWVSKKQNENEFVRSQTVVSWLRLSPTRSTIPSIRS